MARPSSRTPFPQPPRAATAAGSSTRAAPAVAAPRGFSPQRPTREHSRSHTSSRRHAQLLHEQDWLDWPLQHSLGFDSFSRFVISGSSATSTATALPSSPAAPFTPPGSRGSSTARTSTIISTTTANAATAPGLPVPRAVHLLHTDLSLLDSVKLAIAADSDVEAQDEDREGEGHEDGNEDEAEQEEEQKSKHPHPHNRPLTRTPSPTHSPSASTSPLPSGQWVPGAEVLEEQYQRLVHDDPNHSAFAACAKVVQTAEDSSQPELLHAALHWCVSFLLDKQRMHGFRDHQASMRCVLDWLTVAVARYLEFHRWADVAELLRRLAQRTADKKATAAQPELQRLHLVCCSSMFVFHALACVSLAQIMNNEQSLAAPQHTGLGHGQPALSDAAKRLKADLRTAKRVLDTLIKQLLTFPVPPDAPSVSGEPLVPTAELHQTAAAATAAPASILLAFFFFAPQSSQRGSRQRRRYLVLSRLVLALVHDSLGAVDLCLAAVSGARAVWKGHDQDAAGQAVSTLIRSFDKFAKIRMSAQSFNTQRWPDCVSMLKTCLEEEEAALAAPQLLRSHSELEDEEREEDSEEQEREQEQRAGAASSTSSVTSEDDSPSRLDQARVARFSGWQLHRLLEGCAVLKQLGKADRYFFRCFLAHAQLRQGELDSAWAEAAAANTLYPRHPFAHLWMARAWYEAGHHLIAFQLSKASLALVERRSHSQLRADQEARDQTYHEQRLAQLTLNCATKLCDNGALPLFLHVQEDKARYRDSPQLASAAGRVSNAEDAKALIDVFTASIGERWDEMKELRGVAVTAANEHALQKAVTALQEQVATLSVYRALCQCWCGSPEDVVEAVVDAYYGMRTLSANLLARFVLGVAYWRSSMWLSAYDCFFRCREMLKAAPTLSARYPWIALLLPDWLEVCELPLRGKEPSRSVGRKFQNATSHVQLQRQRSNATASLRADLKDAWTLFETIRVVNNRGLRGLTKEMGGEQLFFMGREDHEEFVVKGPGHLKTEAKISEDLLQRVEKELSGKLGLDIPKAPLNLSLEGKRTTTQEKKSSDESGQNVETEGKNIRSAQPQSHFKQIPFTWTHQWNKRLAADRKGDIVDFQAKPIDDVILDKGKAYIVTDEAPRGETKPGNKD